MRRIQKSTSMLKPSKYSAALSSDNSSNISFKGADQSTNNNPSDNPKKNNPYTSNTYFTNKSYGPGNDGNIFRQERMSVSRLLTNS